MTSVSCMGERVWGVNDISFMYGGEGLGGE